MLKIRDDEFLLWVLFSVFHAILQQQSICSLLKGWLSYYFLIMHFTEQTHRNKSKIFHITTSFTLSSLSFWLRRMLWSCLRLKKVSDLRCYNSQPTTQQRSWILQLETQTVPDQTWLHVQVFVFSSHSWVVCVSAVLKIQIQSAEPARRGQHEQVTTWV